MRLFFTRILLGLALLLAFQTAYAAPDPMQERAKAAVAKGLDYLRRTQEPDGSWSRYPATTALAVTAFLRHGHKESSEPALAKGVKYLLQQVKPNGSLYSDANPATALPNYNTAICLTALALTRNPLYKPVIQKARLYLEQSQFDDGEGKTLSDPMYGGIGYGSRNDRPDLSNLQTALEALKTAGTAPNSPVWQKAIVFIQRVQNRRETNDQSWAAEGSNDGGFIYDSKGRSFREVNGKPTSYGSMTYAGLKSYIYAGVKKDDPRAKAAWDWIRGNYSVSENPGLGDMALYYYYHTMAKTLDVFGQRIVTDTAGTKHDWRRDMIEALTSRQKPDGSWFNTNARFWEDQPPLVTSFTLIALSHCLK